MSTFTIETSVAPEGAPGSHLAKVQHWPAVGEDRKPDEWGYGQSHEEAATRALSDMFVGFPKDAK